jgi:PAS domain S-box-containing protein
MDRVARIILAGLLLAISTGAQGMPQAHGGRLDLTDWQFATDGAAALDGEWEFVPGRLVAGAEPWPRDAGVRMVPRSWHARLQPGYGAGTYRLRVDCRDPGQPLALFVPFQNTAAAVFANGREVAHQGRPALDRRESRPEISHQLAILESVQCPLDLRVQVSNYEMYRGGLMRGLDLGTIGAIEQSRLQWTAVAAGAMITTLVLGIFALMVGARPRGDRPALYFGLLCLSVVFGSGLGVERERILQPWLDAVPFEMQLRLLNISWWSHLAWYLILLQSLYPGLRAARFIRALAASAFAMLAFSLLAPASWVPHASAALFLFGPFTGACSCWVLALAWMRGDRDAPILLFSFVVVFATAVYEELFSSHLHLGYQTPLSMAAFVLGPAWLMARRFRRALAIEELRALEEGQRADLLVRATKAGVLDWDTPSDTLRASERYREILGLPAETPASGLPALETLVHPEDRTAVAVRLARPPDRDEGAGVRRMEPIEFRMLRQDGEVIWVHCEAITIFGEQGRALRHIWTFIDISHLKATERKLTETQARLLDEARRAGMAQVATNVLHNVGNVLNSVNVSTRVLAERVRHSRASRVGDVARLLQGSAQGIERDIDKARMLPGYVAQLAQELDAEREELLAEIRRLDTSVDHIKNVVSMQQGYAGASGVRQVARITDLVEDALRLHEAVLANHHIRVHRDCGSVPATALDKTRIMQILVNLIDNARHAMDEVEGERRLGVRVRHEDDRLCVTVSDNGCGIAPENLARVFSHGFTTRAGGHGFGLHSCAVAAREMGGELTVHSDGSGWGAAVTLTLPLGAALDLRATPAPSGARERRPADAPSPP